MFSHPEQISCITLDAELLMFGSMGLSIEQQENMLSVSWLAIGDGGTLIDSGSQDYPNLALFELLQNLSKLHFPSEQDSAQSILWGLHFLMPSDEIESELSSGVWDCAVLVQVLDCIEAFLDDENPTSCFRYMLTW